MGLSLGFKRPIYQDETATLPVSHAFKCEEKKHTHTLPLVPYEKKEPLQVPTTFTDQDSYCFTSQFTCRN